MKDKYSYINVNTMTLYLDRVKQLLQKVSTMSEPITPRKLNTTILTLTNQTFEPDQTSMHDHPAWKKEGFLESVKKLLACKSISDDMKIILTNITYLEKNKTKSPRAMRATVPSGNTRRPKPPSDYSPAPGPVYSQIELNASHLENRQIDSVEQAVQVLTQYFLQNNPHSDILRRLITSSKDTICQYNFEDKERRQLLSIYYEEICFHISRLFQPTGLVHFNGHDNIHNYMHLTIQYVETPRNSRVALYKTLTDNPKESQKFFMASYIQRLYSRKILHKLLPIIDQSVYKFYESEVLYNHMVTFTNLMSFNDNKTRVTISFQNQEWLKTVPLIIDNYDKFEKRFYNPLEVRYLNHFDFSDIASLLIFLFCKQNVFFVGEERRSINEFRKQLVQKGDTSLSTEDKNIINACLYAKTWYSSGKLSDIIILSTIIDFQKHSTIPLDSSLEQCAYIYMRDEYQHYRPDSIKAFKASVFAQLQKDLQQKRSIANKKSLQIDDLNLVYNEQNQNLHGDSHFIKNIGGRGSSAIQIRMFSNNYDFGFIETIDIGTDLEKRTTTIRDAIQKSKLIEMFVYGGPNKGPFACWTGTMTMKPFALFTDEIVRYDEKNPYDSKKEAERIRKKPANQIEENFSMFLQTLATYSCVKQPITAL